MTQNKKFGLIFFIFALLPIAIFVFFDSSINKSISNLLLSLVVLTNSILVYLNVKSASPKSIWYTIPITLGLVSIMILILRYTTTSFLTF